MHHATAGTCPNCFASTSGNFCHQCSQETTLHPPSTREFLHEFIGHYVALEGKLWQSLWLLLLKPGRLTLEYIQGRRVRYVQPLRIYLTFSLIFFALVKFSGLAVFEAHDRVHAPTAASAAKIQFGSSAEKNETFQAIQHGVEFIHPAWGPRAARFLAQPMDTIWNQLVKAFFAYGPYAVFALMPVFALLLKLLYLGSRRRFGAHLLFALHANAFAFAMLTLLVMVPASLETVSSVLTFWLVLYLPLAMRRVYGGGWFGTVLRWGVLMLLHTLCIMLAIAAAAGSAIVV
jgi:hypothetical protein